MNLSIDVPTAGPKPTAVGTMLAWAERVPDRTAFRMISADGGVASIDYANLAKRVMRLSSAIVDATRPNDRVLLAFRQSLDFIIAFQACQMAGVIPVPISPPRLRESNDRIEGIIADCKPRAFLSHRELTKFLRDREFGVDVLDMESMGGSVGVATTRPPARLAFLQYTSGSTGTPKGVMIGHDNLAANVRSITTAFDINETSESVSWLPTYHDMGLVSSLMPMFVGRVANLMAPEDFVRAPLSWIANISRFGADISGGPNFAFEVCARKLLETDFLAVGGEQMDLSRWRIAFVGAEPVHVKTLMRFAQAAAPFGFNPGSFLPCYGMAEATLYVSGCAGTPGQVSRRFAADPLRQGRAIPAAGPTANPSDISDAAPAHLVSCGRLSRELDTEVIIVDPGTRTRLSDGQVGEIWVSGPGVAGGYWNRPEQSATVFQAHLDQGGQARYMRTGDLGFILDRRLFINGRISDVIIVNGVNYFPQDLEMTAWMADPALPAWRSAIFALEDEAGGKIVVFQEMPLVGRRALDPERLKARIRQTIFDQHGISVHDTVLLKPGALPVTSSGKVRRGHCKALYENEQLAHITYNPQPRQPAENPESKSDDEARRSVVVRSQGGTAFTESMRAVLAEVLNIPATAIDVTAPINSYPIDSLKTLEVQMLLESRFGLGIAAETLQSGTPIDMLVASSRDSRSVNAGTFWADSALAPNLLPAPSRRGGGDILVTGATGFLGAELVKELVARCDARIVCLARARGDRSANDRIADRLGEVGMPADVIARRIEIVPGDLLKPNLGISPEAYARLAKNIGTIYHNAALLDFLRPYQTLKAANVETCRALLALAAVGGSKRIMHISSISVLETPVHAGRSLDESTVLDFPETLSAGYAQSKWVADAMLTRARERGFDVAIFRPPWIVGMTSRSAEGSGDFLEKFLKGCIAVGALPASDFCWNVVSVEFVARAIAALSLAPSSPPPVCHLGLTKGIDNQTLAHALTADKIAIEVLPTEQWRKRLWDSLSAGSANPLRPLAPLFIGGASGHAPADSYLDNKIPQMDSRATLARLQILNVDPPVFDAQSFVRIVMANDRAGATKT